MNYKKFEKQQKLPSSLQSWLNKLIKSLNKLDDDQLDVVIKLYKEKFLQQLSEGQTTKEILTGLLPVKDIRDQLYATLDIKTDKKEVKSKASNIVNTSSASNNNDKNTHIWLKFFSSPLWLFAIIMTGLITVIMFLAFIGGIILTPAAIIMACVTYTSEISLPFDLMVAGGMPLVILLVFYIYKVSYNSTRSIKDIVLNSVPREKKHNTKKSFVSKTLGIIALALFSSITMTCAITVAGGLNQVERIVDGDRLHEKVIIDESIWKNEEIISKADQEKIGDVTYVRISGMPYRFSKSISGTTLSSTTEITRHFDAREDIKFEVDRMYLTPRHSEEQTLNISIDTSWTSFFLLLSPDLFTAK